MSEISLPNTDLKQLLEDTRKATQIIGTPFNEAVTWEIISAYSDYFVDGSLAFRTTNHPQEKRDLSLRYTHFFKPHDPYAIAVENGFIVETGHPIEKLMYEAEECISTSGHGLDIGVKHGFEKIWSWFAGSIPNETVAALPSMPRGMARHLDYFKKYNLDDVGVAVMGLDYWHKTTNIYFIYPTGFGTPENVAGMIGDLGFPLPSQRELELNAHTPIVYYTFDWESPEIQRISYVVPSPGELVPTDLDPVITRYVAEVPIASPQRFFTYNATYGRKGNYWKIEADYTGILGPLFQYVFSGKLNA